MERWIRDCGVSMVLVEVLRARLASTDSLSCSTILSDSLYTYSLANRLEDDFTVVLASDRRCQSRSAGAPAGADWCSDLRPLDLVDHGSE